MLTSMKTFLLLLALLSLMPLNSHAQTNAVTTTSTNSVSAAQANVLARARTNAANATLQTNKVDYTEAMRARNAAVWVHRNLMQRIFGMNVSYSGALVPRSEARRAPLPPTAPGYPFENISVNPITGRAEGITLLSIHF